MAKRAKPGELNDQQQRFCLEYLKDMNGTQAAVRAGYSEKTACEQAARLLANVKVLTRVQELRDSQIKRLQVDGDQILRELMRLGYCDVRSIYNEDGSVKHPTEWPDALAAAVASIEVYEEFEFHQGGFHCEGCGRKATKELVGQTKKVKFWNKPQSLELLGKHKTLFSDRVVHEGKITLEDLVTGAGSKESDDGKDNDHD
jgi:phage terminase small subunit